MKLLTYTVFEQKVVRVEHNDEKALNDARTMSDLVEYGDVHLYELVEVEL